MPLHHLYHPMVLEIYRKWWWVVVRTRRGWWWVVVKWWWVVVLKMVVQMVVGVIPPLLVDMNPNQKVKEPDPKRDYYSCS
jgi:hypothetical protein